MQTSGTVFAPEGYVAFEGSLKGFQLGIRTGLFSVSTNASVTVDSSTATIEDSSTHLFFSPRVSYDHMFGRFSLGGDLSYIISLGETAPNLLSLLCVGKFWF